MKPNKIISTSSEDNLIVGLKDGLVDKTVAVHKHEKLSSNPSTHIKARYDYASNTSAVRGTGGDHCWGLLASRLALSSARDSMTGA